MILGFVAIAIKPGSRSEVCTPGSRRSTSVHEEGNMIIHPVRRGTVPRVIAPLGGLLLALGACPPARAVTTVSVDNHPAPVVLAVGETVTIHFDVAKPAGTVQYR